MLVFNDAEESIAPAEHWTALVAAADALTPGDHDAITALLIDAGEFEAAVADSLFPAADGIDSLVDELSAVTLWAARLFVASDRGATSCGARRARLCDAMARVRVDGLPRTARRRVSEGYAFYALHPEAYVAAARDFAASMNPPSAVCIGLRTIGTSLAAVVAATLIDRGVPACTRSVRPRGHPFDRRAAIDPSLERWLVQHSDGTHYLIADEGPGLSGSSFASAARMLSSLGIADCQIGFFPGWDADGSTFRSDTARSAWGRHRRWIARDRHAAMRAYQGDAFVDLSAGAWRERLYTNESEWPPVQPQHERVKMLASERGEIVRFAGLGRYGITALARAKALAAGGFGAPPRGLDRGYLRQAFVEGRPCTPADATPEFLECAARHIGFLSRTQRVGGPGEHDALWEMIETNVREADGTLRIPARSRYASVLADAPRAAIDGRMLPHEWIRTAEGYIKTDALDHACDHFFPGAQDPAWDLAAVETEFGLEPAASGTLLEHYARASRDAGIRARLPFYRVAYAAFQLGYATMAGQSLGESPDRRRFERRAGAFLERLRSLLAG